MTSVITQKRERANLFWSVILLQRHGRVEFLASPLFVYLTPLLHRSVRTTLTLKVLAMYQKLLNTFDAF